MATGEFIDETELVRRGYHVEGSSRFGSSSQGLHHTEPAPKSPSIPSPLPTADSPEDSAWNFGLMTLNRRWALKDSTEVLLLQHFTHELSFFFDFCDQERHFAVVVPHRARTSPPLLDAIFALSARHLSRVKKDFDPFLADQYYSRCIEFLIPELGRVGSTCDDDLLAATVVLRLLEEFDVPLAGSDTYHHTAGTRALLSSQTSHVPCATGLHRAASWAGLRQEIWASLSMRRPPAMRASTELLDLLDPSQDDCAWANRAVSHCLDVLDFCFRETLGVMDTFEALLATNVQWDTDRPPTYDPLFMRSRIDSLSESSSFWDVRLHSPWHVMGWQYITLARFLLITHDPRVVRLSLGRQAALKAMNEEARSALKLVCSIAESNMSVPTASIIACMAVRVGGDLFEDSEERRAVLILLTRLEADQGWPTRDVRARLLDIWGVGDNSPDVGRS